MATTASNRKKECVPFVDIRSQCGPDANPLFAEFRADISCFSLDKFRAHGLSPAELKEIGTRYPIVYPWCTTFDIFRQDVNRRFNIFPLAIMLAKTVDDVEFAFRLARKHRIVFSLRSGSHNFEGYSLSDGIVIDQSRRRKVRLDVCNRTFVAEPGTLLGPLADFLYKEKLVEPSGTCANNGLVGLTLGGGIGFLSRKFGLTCDSLLELEMILANGEKVTVNEKSHPDLLWASKGGGGGNFGIVTSVKLRAYPIDDVVLYILATPLSKESLDTLLPTWQLDSLRYPSRLSSEFNIRDGSIEIVGLYLPNGRHTVERLREILAPLIRHSAKVDIRRVPYLEAAKFFTGRARWRPFFKAKNSFIDRPFAQSAIDIIFRYSSEPLGRVMINRLGGSIAKVPNCATAFPHRDSLYWLLINSQWDNNTNIPANKPSEAEIHFAWIENFYRELGPSLPGKVYVNTPDADIPNFLAQYYGENLKRLIAVKKRYDPGNVFHYPQSIPVD